MVSSYMHLRTALLIILCLSGIIITIYLVHQLMKLCYGSSRRLADEEQDIPDAWRGSLVSLDTLPRTSSTAPLVANALPPAYMPRAQQEGEASDHRPPRPITNLPSLDHRHLPAASPQQLSPSQSRIFILGNDSKESLGTEVSPMDHGSSWTASALQQPPQQLRIPFSNVSRESIETEVSDFVSPARGLSNTPIHTYFRAPAADVQGVDPFPFQGPLSLYLQTSTQIGTVQTHKPVVVSRVDPESDAANGRFVSNMVESMETDGFSNVALEPEPSDDGESPPSPSLKLILERIANARQRWKDKDL